MHRIKLLLGYLAASLLLATGALATPVNVFFSGFIDEVNDPGGLLDPAILPGAPFTVDMEIVGTYTCHNPLEPGEQAGACELLYNDPPPLFPGHDPSPYSQRYTSLDFLNVAPITTVPAVILTVSIGETQFATSWQGITISDNTPEFDTTSSDAWMPSLPCGTNLEPQPHCTPALTNAPEGDFLAKVVFIDSTGSKVDNTDFFIPPSGLSQWDTMRMTIVEPGAACELAPGCDLASGTISAVPEPTTGVLLGLGLACLGMRRRKN